MFTRTPRLLLRPGWPEDAAALATAIGDETIVRNLATAPWPYHVDHARDFLSAERHTTLPQFLITARTHGAPRLVGGCGLGRAPTGEIELGYWIARPHWGLGYATEAGRALIEIARTLKAGPLVASHFLDNPASGNVLRKLGFRPTGQVVNRDSAGRGGEAPCALYALAEDDALPDPDCYRMAA
jgi:RimJ/RimL family protein N-acetyltransferase